MTVSELIKELEKQDPSTLVTMSINPGTGEVTAGLGVSSGQIYDQQNRRCLPIDGSAEDSLMTEAEWLEAKTNYPKCIEIFPFDGHPSPPAIIQNILDRP